MTGDADVLEGALGDGITDDTAGTPPWPWPSPESVAPQIRAESGPSVAAVRAEREARPSTSRIHPVPPAQLAADDYDEARRRFLVAAAGRGVSRRQAAKLLDAHVNDDDPVAAAWRFLIARGATVPEQPRA